MANPVLPTVVAGIATAGRPEQLKLTLGQIARQFSPPDRLIVCPASTADADEHALDHPGLPKVEVVYGQRGLTAQRNTILSACGDADVVVFFDDDFYPRSDYIARIRQLFARHEHVVVATGHPEHDGITGPGIGHEEAIRLLNLMAVGSSADDDTPLRETYNGYGCNMAFRLWPIREHGLRFDEALPLYGWLEDLDFSRQVARFGRVVESSVLQGVHLGVKGGRVSGVRFGYSQISNPCYMIGKGTLSLGLGLRQMARNVSKNLLRALAPEPWVDRRGRLRGNWRAVIDLLRGRMHPGNVNHFR